MIPQIDNPDWEKEFQVYIESLDCPKLSRKEETLDWLLGRVNYLLKFGLAYQFYFFIRIIKAIPNSKNFFELGILMLVS